MRGQTVLLLLIAITAGILMGIVLALSVIQMKINFHINEETAQKDQLPTMQALSYSTVGRLRNHLLISFYDMAALSAATDQLSFYTSDGAASLPALMMERLNAYSRNQLSLFYPDCFEYTINNIVRFPIFTDMLAAGDRQAASCAEYSGQVAPEGLETYQKKNYIYFLPLPPTIENQARLSEQFIRIFSLKEAVPVEREGCKAKGAAAGAANECCSGQINGGFCQ
jgi:hypothetical protein